MPATSSLVERLSSQRVLATFVTLKDPSAAGLVAAAGFHAVVVDREHGVMSPEAAANLITMAQRHGAAAIVRVPEPGRSTIQDALEAGADGVLVPMVETVQQACAIASWSRYAPRGTRGIHTFTAGSGFAKVPGAELPTVANDRVLVCAQIETATGLESCEAIAAVDGIDLVFYGPGDLALSLGVAPGSEAMKQAIVRVAKAAEAHGKRFGAFVATEADAREAIRLGACLLVASADVAMLSIAAKATLEMLGRASESA